MMFRTTNPTLNKNSFQKVAHTTDTEKMTLNGTLQKIGILFLLTLIPALFMWSKFFEIVEVSTTIEAGLIGGLIAGLILALITIFSKKNAMYTAPLYAIAEGFVLGGISAIMEASFSGIVLQAITLTFGVLLIMLYLYKSRIIKVTDKLRMGIVSATGAIVLVYFVSFIANFFGVGIPMIYSGGIIGIGFSLLVVGIAAFNLLLDFDLIEQGVEYQVPKYMEWYSAFSIMVTLIWLYVEILRLLAKLRGRD